MSQISIDVCSSRAQALQPVKRSAAQRWLVAALAVLVSLLCVVLPAKTARAANWYDGSPVRVPHVCNNFIAVTNEDLLWGYVDYQDIDTPNGARLPLVGEVYYIRVILAGLGCSGAFARPEIALPNGTSFAISNATPIRCSYETVGRPNSRGPVSPGDGGCPIQGTAGVFPGAPAGRFTAFPPRTLPYWALPTSALLTIEIPVRSTRVMRGTFSNDYVVAAINVLDNNPGGGNPPWVGGTLNGSLPYDPWQGIFVLDASAAKSPYVSYSDSTATASTVTASTTVTVNNYNCVANATLTAELFSLRTPPVEANSNGNQCIAGCCAAGCTDDFVTYRFDWNSMLPDENHKWRAFLQNLSVKPGCARDVADAQTNAANPQWSYLHTLPLVQKPAMYTLFIQSEGGSAIATPALAPGSTRYAPGTPVKIALTPAAGNVLAALNLDGQAVALTSTVDVVMSSDHKLIATFNKSGIAGDGGAPPGDAGGADAGGSAGSDDGGSDAMPPGANAPSGCSTGPVAGGFPIALFGLLALAAFALRRRPAA